MIKICIITDDLLYQRQIEKTIRSIMLNTAYTIENNLDDIDRSAEKIYIFDLESANLEKIYSLSDVCDSSFIFLTSKKDEMNIFSNRFLYCEIIDKENDYLQALKESIEKAIHYTYVLKQYKPCFANIILDNGIDLSISIEKVSFMIQIDHQYIIVTKNNYQNYTFNFTSYPALGKKLEETLLANHFSKTQICEKEAYVATYKSPTSHKIYSKEFKEMIVLEYLHGISAKYLADKYSVSLSAIYLWIRKYKVSELLKEYEQDHEKCKKIKEIVNSK